MGFPHMAYASNSDQRSAFISCGTKEFRKLPYYGRLFLTKYHMFDPAETNATEIFQLQRADDEESNRRLDAMKAMVPMKLFYNRFLDGWNSLDAEVQSTVPVDDKAAVSRAYAKHILSHYLPEADLTDAKIDEFCNDVHSFLTLYDKVILQQVKGAHLVLLNAKKGYADKFPLGMQSVMSLAKIDAEFANEALELYDTDLYAVKRLHGTFTRGGLTRDLLELCNFKLSPEETDTKSCFQTRVSVKVDYTRENWRKIVKDHKNRPNKAQVNVDTFAATSISDVAVPASNLEFIVQQPVATVDSINTVNQYHPQIRNDLPSYHIDGPIETSAETFAPTSVHDIAIPGIALDSITEEPAANLDFINPSCDLDAKSVDHVIASTATVYRGPDNEIGQRLLTMEQWQKIFNGKKEKEESKAEKPTFQLIAKPLTQTPVNKAPEVHQEKVDKMAHGHMAARKSLPIETTTTKIVEGTEVAAKNPFSMDNKSDNMKCPLGVDSNIKINLEASISKKDVLEEKKIKEQAAAGNKEPKKKKKNEQSKNTKKRSLPDKKKNEAPHAIFPGCSKHQRKLIDLQVLEHSAFKSYIRFPNNTSLGRLLPDSVCKGTCQRNGRSLLSITSGQQLVNIHFCKKCSDDDQEVLSWFCSSCYNDKNKADEAGGRVSKRTRVPKRLD